MNRRIVCGATIKQPHSVEHILLLFFSKKISNHLRVSNRDDHLEIIREAILETRHCDPPDSLAASGRLTRRYSAYDLVDK